VTEVTDTSITGEVDEPGHVLTERISFPCLITVDKGAYEPRLPSFRLKLATAGRDITWLKLDDLEDRDPAHYGLNGSPTQVKRIFPPDNHVEQIELSGTDVEKAAKACGFLDEQKLV
jgi:electron transfer flavoprotein beta subunit